MLGWFCLQTSAMMLSQWVKRRCQCSWGSSGRGHVTWRLRWEEPVVGQRCLGNLQAMLGRCLRNVTNRVPLIVCSVCVWREEMRGAKGIGWGGGGSDTPAFHLTKKTIPKRSSTRSLFAAHCHYYYLSFFLLFIFWSLPWLLFLLLAVFLPSYVTEVASCFLQTNQTADFCWLHRRWAAGGLGGVIWPCGRCLLCRPQHQ